MVSRSFAHLKHSVYYCKILDEANKQYKKGDKGIDQGLSLLDINIENIKKGQQWAEQAIEIDPKAAYLCSTYPDAGSFILQLRLHSNELIQWRKSALLASHSLDLDHKAIAAHNTGLGKSYLDIGHFQQAEQYFRKALKLHEESANLLGVANALGNLGVINKNKGNFELANEYHQKSLFLFEQLQDDRGIGNQLGNLGTLCVNMRLTTRAISFFERSLIISQKLGDMQSQIISLFSIGEALSLNGDYEGAIKTLEKAEELCDRINDPINKGKVLGNLGNAYYRSGNYLMALQYFKKTEASENEVGNDLGIGKAFFNIAMCYISLQDYEKAVANAEIALQAFRKLKHPYASKVEGVIIEWKKHIKPVL